MSLDFDGVDDYFVSATGQSWGTDVSFACWFNANTLGEGNIGAFLSTDPYQRTEMYWLPGINVRVAHGAFGYADTVSPVFASVPGWKWVCMTASATPPTLYTYADNVFTVLTDGAGLVSSGTGWGGADGGGMVLGNVTPNSQTFDGLIGEVVLYTRRLTADEARAIAILGANAVPDHLNYYPLDVDLRNYGASGIPGVTVGPVLAENPPARPAGRRG